MHISLLDRMLDVPNFLLVLDEISALVVIGTVLIQDFVKFFLNFLHFIHIILLELVLSLLL